MLRYNGYYISEHALKSSSKKWLRIVTHAVKRCQHGPECSQCCHVFTRQDLIRHSHIISRDPERYGHIVWLDSVDIRLFFWEMQYGQQPVRPKHAVIRSRCKTDLCMNLLHMYRGARRDKEGDFWAKMGLCHHGMLCTKCCWDWRESIHPKTFKTTGRRIGIVDFQIPGNSRSNTVMAYRVAQYYTFKKYPARNALGYLICGSEGLCCNPFHIRYIPSAVIAREMVATREQKRILEKKLYIYLAA